MVYDGVFQMEKNILFLVGLALVAGPLVLWAFTYNVFDCSINACQTIWSLVALGAASVCYGSYLVYNNVPE